MITQCERFLGGGVWSKGAEIHDSVEYLTDPAACLLYLEFLRDRGVSQASNMTARVAVLKMPRSHPLLDTFSITGKDLTPDPRA